MSSSSLPQDHPTRDERGGHSRDRLEPVTRAFIDSLAGAPPLYTMSPAAAHKVLTDLQSAPVPAPPADVVDTTFPVGPTGETRIRIVRPQGARGPLPLLLYCHGGGWVLGDTITHDRLVRELAAGVGATVVFVDYVNSPEARYPTQNEQAYASLVHAVAHAADLGIDPSRVAVAGDSVGGNMAAALTLMAKARQGPSIAYQVLFYPLLDYLSDRPSYRQYADGPWLIADTMKWMFDLQGLDGSETDVTAYPVRASVEQLRGLPDCLLITDGDILQDEGEEYASKLSAAGVRVTSVRYNQTVHDFVMLNPLAETPAARGAIAQAITALRGALHPGS
ncbi:esterase [Luteitalea sp. TBR-22]|uniref:alpha/beta hydrolase n=1 Tax=Luteitalea sp. TBR-22 TaxID=2802971 RepID=UPI001AF957DE|nr:alpha/beta hydrolase [Luteitalea sp. TBR-22]BCS32585.1 esterase [Luteitalea sp. TBR-22]